MWREYVRVIITNIPAGFAFQVYCCAGFALSVYCLAAVTTILIMLASGSVSLSYIQCGDVITGLIFSTILTKKFHSSPMGRDVSTYSNLCFASVIVVMFTISYFTGPRYNGARLYHSNPWLSTHRPRYLNTTYGSVHATCVSCVCFWNMLHWVDEHHEFYFALWIQHIFE